MPPKPIEACDPINARGRLLVEDPHERNPENETHQHPHERGDDNKYKRQRPTAVEYGIESCFGNRGAGISSH
jgi:hypothetical protein